MSCILSFQHVINTTLLTLYMFSLPNLLHVSHVFSSGLNTFQVLSTHTCKQPSCGRAEKRRHWRRHLAHLMCHALPHIPSLQANHTSFLALSHPVPWLTSCLLSFWAPLPPLNPGPHMLGKYLSTELPPLSDPLSLQPALQLNQYLLFWGQVWESPLFLLPD